MQLHAEKVGVPARDEVLRGRDTDPKLKNPSPSFSSYPLWEQQSWQLISAFGSLRGHWEFPSPVESSSFRNPALAPRTQPAPAGAHTHSHAHPPTHAHPVLFPRYSSLRGNGKGALEPTRSWLQHPPKARTTRSSATATTTPRHRPGERPGPSPTTPQSSSPTAISQYFNPFRQTSQVLGVG